MKPTNTPIVKSGISRIVSAPVATSSAVGGERERDDPRPVDRALGMQREDVRQAVVAREQAHQHGQAAEARVRREAEHERDGEVGDVEHPPRPESARAHLREDRDAAARHDVVGADERRRGRPASRRGARRARARFAAPLRMRGLRNAGVPFEIASTPVTAEQPDANALQEQQQPERLATGLIGHRRADARDGMRMEARPRR